MPAVVKNMIQDVPHGRILQAVFTKLRGIYIKAASDEFPGGYGPPYIDVDGNPINPPLGTPGTLPSTQLYVHKQGNDPRILYGVQANAGWQIWKEGTGIADPDMLTGDGGYEGNWIPNVEVPTLGYKFSTDQVSAYPSGEVEQRSYNTDLSGLVYRKGQPFIDLGKIDYGASGGVSVRGLGLKTIGTAPNDALYVYIAFIRIDFYGSKRHQFGIARINYDSPNTDGTWTAEYLTPGPTLIDQNFPILMGPPIRFNSDCTEAALVSDTPYAATGDLLTTTTGVAAVGVITLTDTTWSIAVQSLASRRLYTQTTTTKINNPPTSASTSRVTSGVQTDVGPIAVDYDGQERIITRIVQTDTSSSTTSRETAATTSGSENSSSTTVSTIEWGSRGSYTKRNRSFTRSSTFTLNGLSTEIDQSAVISDRNTQVAWIDVPGGFWIGGEMTDLESPELSPAVVPPTFTYDYVRERTIDYKFGKYDSAYQCGSAGTRKIREESDFPGPTFDDLFPDLPDPLDPGGTTVSVVDTTSGKGFQDTLEMVRVILFGSASGTPFPVSYLCARGIPSGGADPQHDHGIASWYQFDRSEWEITISYDINGASNPSSFPEEVNISQDVISGHNDGDIISIVFGGQVATKPRVFVLGVV